MLLRLNRERLQKMPNKSSLTASYCHEFMNQVGGPSSDSAGRSRASSSIEMLPSATAMFHAIAGDCLADRHRRGRWVLCGCRDRARHGRRVWNAGVPDLDKESNNNLVVWNGVVDENNACVLSWIERMLPCTCIPLFGVDALSYWHTARPYKAQQSTKHSEQEAGIQCGQVYTAPIQQGQSRRHP